MASVDPFAVDAASVDPAIADSLSASRLSDLLVAARPANPDSAFAEALAGISRRELMALVMTYLLAHGSTSGSTE